MCNREKNVGSILEQYACRGCEMCNENGERRNEAGLNGEYSCRGCKMCNKEISWDWIQASNKPSMARTIAGDVRYATKEEHRAGYKLEQHVRRGKQSYRGHEIVQQKKNIGQATNQVSSSA